MRNRHKYPADWFDVIRPQILARDGFRCQLCNVKQRAFGYYDKELGFIECDSFMTNWAKKQGLKPRNIWLQVAHLDQNTENNDFSNLKTLCPRCHLRHDNEHNVIKRKQSIKSRKI